MTVERIGPSRTGGPFRILQLNSLHKNRIIRKSTETPNVFHCRQSVVCRVRAKPVCAPPHIYPFGGVMATACTGKLIIRSIPDDSRRERIVDFMCSCAKGTPRETVAAGLERLPLTLGNAMPADSGERIVTSLQALGADAVFIRDGESRPISRPVPASPAVPRSDPATVARTETAATRKAPGAAVKNTAAKQRSAAHDIKALVIVLAVLVAGLCGATAIFLPALQAASDPGVLLNKLLSKNAEMNNRKCPRDLNPQLRLDGFAAGDKKMTINYTLLEVDSTAVNGNDLRPYVSRDIRRQICRERNSSELLKKGVAFVFAVHGRDGGLIFDYQVLQKDCDYDLQ